MPRVIARGSARVFVVAVLALVGLMLADCSDNREESSLTGPMSPTPSFQIVPGSGTWATVASLPTPRAAPNAEVVNNILYVLGQDNGGIVTGVLVAYDPLTDLWTPKSPMPTARGTIAVGVVNGILYAAGGWTGGTALSTNEAYDPSTDMWTTRAPMHTARRSLSGAAVNGVLYAIGGSAPGVVSFPTIEAYDPVTNAWTTKAPMPTSRGSTGVGVVNGKIYVVGGNNGTSLSTVEAYDPATDSWTAKSPMPTAREGVRVAVVNDILYAVGGTSGTVTALATVEAYDPANDSWTTVASMPTARGYPGVAAVNGTIYVAGGYNGVILSVVEALTPAAAPSCVPPLSGLVSWWPGEANANDAVGGNNGVLQGGAGFGSGEVGQAIDLDGSSGYVRVANQPTLNTPDGLTVDAWIYPTAFGGARDIATKWDDPTGQWSWIFKLHNDGSGRLRIEISRGDHNALGDLGGSTILPPNKWSHVAATYDRSTSQLRLYVNGGIDSEGFANYGNVAINNSATDLLIGATNGQTGTPSEYFQGRIDELQLFDRALSPSEINAIFTAGSAGKCAPTTTPSTITLDAPSLSQTYDGTPKVVTFSTTPAGVSGVTITYDGSATAPTNAGSYSVLAHLDNPDFSAPDVTGTLVIHPAGQTIAFSSLAAQTFGTSPFAVSATATSGLTVSFAVGAGDNCSIAGNMVTLTGAGSCSVTASQAGNGNYDAAVAVKQTFTIARATPLLTWSTPASIVFGTALGGAQLNATATGVGAVSLTGTFTYSPAAGTILSPGPHPLGVSFTPDDQTNYTGAAKTVSITVLYSTAVGHGFLQPINVPPQVESVFKIGSTIPVKFQLFLADGVTPVSTALATIQVNKVSSGVPSGVNENVTSTVPNQGISFRYDPTSQQYIFNLGTKGWTAGSYQITALLDDGSQIMVVIGAR